MYAERQLAPTDLHEGTRVEVATHFTGSWTHGFEVAALHRDGCQVRRISDGAVLPVDFDYSDVRVLAGVKSCDASTAASDFVDVGRARSSGCELVARFERAIGPCEIAAIAIQLGDTGEHCAIRPLLTRLGERAVQAQPDLADALCAALVALGVMWTCGACNFAFRPRHLLEPDVVDAITELGPAVPMRYLIARQA
jgi:hypothetical protein